MKAQSDQQDSAIPPGNPGPALNYASSSVAPGWLHEIGRPPGAIVGTFAGIALVLILYSVSTPGTRLMPAFVGALCTLIVACVMVVRTVAALCLVVRFHEIPSRGQWVKWLALPALGLIITLCVQRDIPLRVTFSMSQGAMEQLVRDVNAANGSIPDRRVGWYYAKHISPIQGGGAYFFVEGTGFADQVGFAYLPPGSAPSRFLSRHYKGHWYIITDLS